MKHTMRLNDEPFEMIKSGEKTIELRLYDEKRRLIRVGDEIEFVHAENSELSLLCRVISIHMFSSFEELYDGVPLLKCGYTGADVETASPKDMELYYTRDQQARYGVVGIEIELK